MLRLLLSAWIALRKRRGKLSFYLAVLRAYEGVRYGQAARLPLFVDRLVYALLGKPLFLWRYFVSQLHWTDVLAFVSYALFVDVDLPGFVHSEGKAHDDYPYPGYLADSLFYTIVKLGLNPARISIEEGIRLGFMDNERRLNFFSLLWYLSERTVSYDSSGKGKALEFPIKVRGTAVPLSRQVIFTERKPKGANDVDLPPWLAG